MLVGQSCPFYENVYTISSLPMPPSLHDSSNPAERRNLFLFFFAVFISHEKKTPDLRCGGHNRDMNNDKVALRVAAQELGISLRHCQRLAQRVVDVDKMVAPSGAIKVRMSAISALLPQHENPSSSRGVEPASPPPTWRH